ncbi:MATE family efflux transporter [Georgfuchsia toluolica]|nr:MATE family efflux transporter [Georgfuchsia toluolica]
MPAATKTETLPLPTAAAPTRAIIHLALPMLVAQVAVMLNGTMDTVMAGQISPLDLATVGIGASIYAAIFISAMGVLLALTPIIAHHYGAGRMGDIGEEVRQGAWLSLALAALAMLVLTHPGPLLALSQLTPEMDGRVRAYLAVLAWAAPAGFAFRLLYGFSAGIARPRPIMVFNLFGLGLKIFFNWIFMFGHLGAPALGALGCGVSSVLSSWLVMLSGWLWCAREAEYHCFGIFAAWSWPRRARLLALLKLGLPMGATFVFDVTAFTFMALFVARLGPTASGAHQIAANLSALMFMIPMSMGSAVGALCGQALGRGDAAAARHTGLAGLRLGMGFAAAVSLSLWLGRSWLAALYTVDAEVRLLAASVIALIAIYHLADALQAIAVSLLRSYKKAMVPMAIYAVALWGVGLPGGIALGLHGIETLGIAPLGVPGFWIAAIVGLAGAGFGVTLYWWQVSRCAVRPAL